jgi:thiol-disulfide isomerase/thioredoxin
VKLTLLTRSYCHLCDEMRDAVAPLAAAAGVPVVVVDVDDDPKLEAVYGELVPVLFAGEPGDGAELCHHRFDRVRVERAMARLRSAGD